MACAPGSTERLISARWACLASVLAKGMTRATPRPRPGQIAPKMWAHFARWLCGARGRVPLRAQRRANAPLWPTRISSSHEGSSVKAMVA